MALFVAALLSSAGIAAVAPAASAATPNTLDLRILLVGNGSADPTTAAWESALSDEGVPYTEVDGTGSVGSETVTLPSLSSGSTGFFNGVVIADDPADFASGQFSALDSYESSFGVRQVDGYVYPTPSLGMTEATGGAIDNTTGTLTAAGLADFPELAGPIPFSTGTYGYAATVNAGAPYTSIIENSTGDTLAGIYQHPSTDAQASVSELALNFNYNSGQLQWLLLAPGLINWVTQGTHLGLYRNYVEMDIDDTFTPDDAWDTTNHTIDYSDADALRMQPSDVPYAADWSEANHFRMDQLFNYGSSIAAQSNDLEYDGANSQPTGYDPLTAAFQANDPNTGKPYSDDFGWISHTYDTPYMDVGCATQNYIEAELNENTSSIAAPGSAGTGGLGIAESDNDSLALGYEDPQVFVPGNHSGFADLIPGNPGTVDPPDLDTSDAATTTGGALAAGTYEYAVTDQFKQGDPTSTDESAAYVTAPITVGSGTTNSVTLTWQSICHAADYLIYRAAAPYTSWSLVGTVDTPTSQAGTLPDNSSGDPASTTDVTGGGELEQTFTDTGSAGTPEAGWTPPVQENAQELPWEQNPYFIPALEAVGITAVGDDASKPYPNPPTDEFGYGVPYTGAEYAAGQTFVDGTSQVVPRHPINIYYNASTEAEEVDEYNTLYLPSSVEPYGTCDPSTTVCLSAPVTFQYIVNQVVSQMYQFMLTNNPEPSYVHQTNLMGSPPGCSSPTVCNAAPPGSAPATAPTTGDGLLYSVLNPLLAEYNADFNTTTTPFEQPTEGAIATILANQSAWGDGVSSVSASETNGTVTVSNSAGALNVPVTVPPGTTVNGADFATTYANDVWGGPAYGGELSAWLNVGTSPIILNEGVAPTITSASAATSTTGAPFSFTVTTTGEPAPSLTESGALPSGVTFTDNGNGTATIAGTPATGSGGSFPITITATNGVGTAATQSFTLTNDQPPTITSANAVSFVAGTAGTYSITTTGYPAPTLQEAGALPGGMNFADNGNGTGTISGTPASNSAGSYPVTITATNNAGGGAGSTATLNLTITVNAPSAPTITSSSTADFTLNQPGSVAITTTGSPTPAISETGALPAGLTFTDNGNGTATIAGTPTGATGTYPLTIGASNGISPDASQSFTLTVGTAPAFTSANSTTFTAGTAGSFTVTTSGYPAPSIGYDNVPPGMTFTDNGDGTATLSGTPTTGGSYAMALTADSGYGSAQQTLTVTVNQAPTITSDTGATFSTGEAGTFTVTTTGYPDAALSETGTLPSGVTFTDNGNGTATLAGTPASGTENSYPITITASNGNSPDATQNFTLTVAQGPVAPSITSDSATTFTVGSAGTFSVTATGDPTPTLGETGALPSGVTFTDNGNGTGTLAGMPAPGSQGTYTITITANNGDPATQTFTLTVNPANAAPAFTSASSSTFSVGTAGTFAVTTTGYPTAALSMTSTPALPAGLSFTDNGNGTATLSGTPPAGSQGTYTLTISAGNTVATTLQSFVLTVNSGLSITSANAATAVAGKAFTFSVTTTGTPTPTLSHTGTLPSGITFTANSNGTATLAGTPAATAHGIYPITISAKNATGSASQAFTLTVDETPTFSSAAAVTETAGTAFTFNVTTTAYPTAALGATGLPSGASFTDNGNGTGTLSGNTSVASGSYTISLTAQNTGGTTTQSFKLTVNAAGTKVPVPTFTSAAADTVPSGKAFTFTITTVGSPTTTYTTSVTHTGALPSGVSFNNLGNGTATISGTPSATSGGTYPITLTAKNSAGTVTQSFILTVTAAPTISSAATATATVGSTFSFTMKASGAPTPTMSESGALPMGLTWTDNGNGTATLAGTPGVGQGGVYHLTLSASNSGGTATQAFTLTVNQAPAITSGSSAHAVHGTAFTFTFTATGYPAATLSHTGTVAGLTFTNKGNGTATLSGTPRTAGTYTLTITAKNSVGTSTQTFTLTVT